MNKYSLNNTQWLCVESDPDRNFIEGDIYMIIDGHNDPDYAGDNEIDVERPDGSIYTLKYRRFYFYFRQINQKKPLLYDGFHKIKEVDAIIKGKPVKRERLLIKSAVGGLIIDEDDRMALVTQFRPTINDYALEIPAGVLDKDGLSPIEVLLEELNEECHIKDSDILDIKSEPFADYYMIIGSSDAKISLHEIRVTRQTNQIVADADVERVEWKTLDEIEKMLKQGVFKDSKTLIAIDQFKSLFANNEPKKRNPFKINEFAKVHYWDTDDEKGIEVIDIISITDTDPVTHDVLDEIKEDIAAQPQMHNGDFDCLVHIVYDYVRSNGPFDPEEWDIDIDSITIVDIKENHIDDENDGLPLI